MVARGFTQQWGVDFNDTFAPVMKLKSLRLIIILSSKTKKRRKLAQLDVKTAFLNAEVKEDIYIYAPQGMSVRNDEMLKLNKALYGIKQAPREWYIKISTFIITSLTNCNINKLMSFCLAIDCISCIISMTERLENCGSDVK